MDVGGNLRSLQLERPYYQNVKGVIFIVDSTDAERMDEAKEELFSRLNEEQL